MCFLPPSVDGQRKRILTVSVPREHTGDHNKEHSGTFGLLDTLAVLSSPSSRDPMGLCPGHAAVPTKALTLGRGSLLGKSQPEVWSQRGWRAWRLGRTLQAPAAAPPASPSRTFLPRGVSSQDHPEEAGAVPSSCCGQTCPIWCLVSGQDPWEGRGETL